MSASIALGMGAFFGICVTLGMAYLYLYLAALSSVCAEDEEV